MRRTAKLPIALHYRSLSQSKARPVDVEARVKLQSSVAQTRQNAALMQLFQSMRVEIMTAVSVLGSLLCYDGH